MNSTQETLEVIKANATRQPTENQRLWASWTFDDGSFLERSREIYGVPRNWELHGPRLRQLLPVGKTYINC